MKKLLSALVFSMIAFGAQAQKDGLPSDDIRDLGTNQTISFKDIIAEDSVNVISFWATWCVPCKAEIKNIAKKLDGWKKEVPFRYITISIDEARAENMARTFAANQGWTFPHYIDVKADLKRSLNFQSVPYTLIIGKGGKIAGSHIGYQEGNEDKLFEEVKELAKK